MRDNKELTKYVSAFVYGDGSIQKDPRDNGNCWFSTVKTEKNLDFLEWASTILSDITKTKITPRYKGQSYTYTAKDGKQSVSKPAYDLDTARHPFFNPFRDRFYSLGRKAIDPHYLTLLDWETLAIFYMDDGTIAKKIDTKTKKCYSYYLYLCTQGFSYGDNWLLKKAIKEKLDLEFNIQSQFLKSGIKYMLYLRSKDMYKFLDGVSKYILPSFQYKLDPIEFYKSRMNVSVTTDGDIV